jgi:serine/threonine protein kinase
MATVAGYQDRFRREAQVAARLTEPHIIPIHDTGEIEGRLYLVMPIIDGIDVHTLLARDGPMTPPRAVQVIKQLAAALNVAHHNGRVHRDIKPSNALMTPDEHVYLIDFGIAHDASATRPARRCHRRDTRRERPDRTAIGTSCGSGACLLATTRGGAALNPPARAYRPRRTAVPDVGPEQKPDLRTEGTRIQVKF